MGDGFFEYYNGSDAKSNPSVLIQIATSSESLSQSLKFDHSLVKVDAKQYKIQSHYY